MRRTEPQLFVSVAGPGGIDRVDVSQRVISLTYEDDEKKADKLTLKVDNFDLTEFERPTWRKGNILYVSWGYAGALSPERECVILNVKGGTELSIEANGKEMLLNRSHKMRHWENVRRSDVVREIAAEYGFVGDRVDIQDTAVIYPQVTQARLTDYQLIRDLATREKYEFFIDFDGLHFHERNLKQKPIREFVYYTDPLHGDVIAWAIESDIASGKPGSVTVKGRNPDTGENFESTADNTSAQRPTLAPTIESPAPVDLIDQASGVQSEGVLPDKPPAASEAIYPTAEGTEEGAKREAEGLYSASQLQAIKLTMTCWGDPDTVAKSTAALSGFGPVVSGNYYVTSVKHDVGAGYTMVLKLRRQGMNKGSGGSGAGAGGAGDAESAGTLNKETAPVEDAALDEISQKTGAQTETTFGDKRQREGSPK